MSNSMTEADEVRILWVEDNEWEHGLILETLRTQRTDRDRFTIDFLRDGDEALRKLERLDEKARLPDLVVVDLRLPSVSGLDLLATLRKLPYASGLPAVVFSVSTNPERKRSAAKAGALGYFPKPPDLENYGKTVSWILELAARTSNARALVRGT